MHLLIVVTLFSALTSSFSSCRQRELASEQKAVPYARRVIGEGQDFRAVPIDEVLLKNSFLDRRREGWRIAKEAMRAVSIALQNGPDDTTRNKVPLFQTWYDSQEFQDMARFLYKCRLTTAQRRAVTSPNSNFIVPTELVGATLAAHQQRKLPSTWSAERYRLVLDQLRNPEDFAGLNGVEGTGVSLFSPALLRHYLENLASIYRCTENGTPGNSPDLFAACFSQPFPKEAVAVKTTFNRQATGAARFDTDAPALTKIFTSTIPKGINRWATQSPPVAKFDLPIDREKIYSVHFRQAEQDYGNYLLTGLHVTTKEIPQWMWVTLWWSDNPASDFGEDRPGDFTDGIDARFANYKMCVVSDFEETDPMITTPNPAIAGLEQWPSLLAAARATNQFSAPNSWCSNPFIEHMPHGAKSNCIGCHQRASVEGIPPADDLHPPVLRKVTNRFPADFLASFHGGIRDDFQGTIQEAIASINSEGPDLDLAECQLDP